MILISFPLIFSCILVGQTTCSVENNGKLQNYQGKTITDDTLRKLLESFRLMLHDPEVLPDQHIFINQTEMEFPEGSKMILNIERVEYSTLCQNLFSLANWFLNGSLTHCSVTDPTRFKIETVHVDMQNLEFTTKVSYTALTISGTYGVNMDNKYAHLQSTDHFSVVISNMASSIFIKLNLTKDQTLQVENSILDYNMTVKVNFENLGSNSEVSNTMNNLINQLMPSIIKSTKPDIQEIANKMILEKSKFLLTGMTLEQLIDMINNFVG